MPCIRYVEKTFRQSSLDVIRTANDILDEYQRDHGLDLTLRQLYYQFVARGLLSNKDSEYKRLGGIVNNARLAGLIDWSRIVDRTRELRANSHWDTPASIIRSAANFFQIDKWMTQPDCVEVWIEKDALLGVIEAVCYEMDVAYFSCRGYTSQSEMWSAAMRLREYERLQQGTIVLHLGDHDPSGVDMTRDIANRLQLFGAETTVKRIALTMEQVEQYGPPPNPAKLSDSRARDYVDRFGNESWELDALDPTMLVSLIREKIEDELEPIRFDAATEKESEHKRLLETVSRRWEDVVDFVDCD